MNKKTGWDISEMHTAKPDSIDRVFCYKNRFYHRSVKIFRFHPRAQVQHCEKPLHILGDGKNLLLPYIENSYAE
jgi:hypothetical protein